MTAGIKKYKSNKFQRKKKKVQVYSLLAKTKLNTIEVLICKTLTLFSMAAGGEGGGLLPVFPF